MNLYQLQYFLEVARELNFSRAAANLHISPPAVTRSIQLLEASINRKLFARTRRHVSLTSAGESLKARVEKIFDEIESARMELAAEGAASPAMLRVGSREMVTHYLLPRPLLEFKKRHPGTRFGLYELGPEELAGALKRDQIDFGFYYSEIADPQLEMRHLGALRSHIYSSKRLWPAGKRGKPWKAVLELPFIAPRYFRADPSVPSPDGFPDHRHARNIQYEAEFLETHRRFVLDGLAVAVLPDLVVREEWKKGEVIRLDGPSIHRDIYFFKRKSKPLHPAVDEFLASLRGVIRSAASAH